MKVSITIDFDDFRINRVIKYLIFGDLVFEASWGLISPVFAIFVVENIVGGNPTTVGFASAIYLILFSLFRIPFSIYLDKRKGETDDFLAMFFGFLISSILPFFYIFSKYPWQIYFLQGVYGISTSAAFAGYMSLFTKKIDVGKEATEWGIRASLISLVSGITAAIGGFLVTKFGFTVTFILVGIFNLLSCLLLFVLKNEFLKK
jgi:MFS family permease